MLDFTSALYLGLDHGSRALPGWERLSLGKPAALEMLPGTRATERQLAALMGCERALLAASTLHLFWDLFAVLARQRVNIFLDRSSYPILRWGVERAACSGIPVRTFRPHDPGALRAVMRESSGRPPIIVTDGYCPGCGRAAPIPEYLRLAAQHGGQVVVDDTQSLGIFGWPCARVPYGTGGGGSMQRFRISSERVVIGSSMAKAFGVPVAVLGGSAAVLNEFESLSATRVHCSPPSAATIAAADHALRLNRRFGDALRVRLARLVEAFREGLKTLGLAAGSGLFPLQTLRLPQSIDAGILHERLKALGVKTVLHQGGDGWKPRISFVLTARHRPWEIKEALVRLQDALAGKTARTQRGVESNELLQL